MQSKKEEIIIVAIAAMMLFGVFGAIAYFDRSHGDVGTEYGVDQVDVVISGSQGKITVPDLPEDLIFIGASQPASMDFSVTNNDPDNDIDTIFVTIPGSTITGTGYEWYVPSEPRDWNMSLPQSDVAMFQAMTDYPGLNYGGSAQYDTAGGEDDALDHDPDRDISESITVKVDFTAPSVPGFRRGAQGINVEVADLLTENANPKESMPPFPYPYFVTQTGSRYVVMILGTPTCDLEIVYDQATYFGASRASGFQTFDSGMKYVDGDGNTIVAVSHPGDGKVIKPLVRARTAGLTGQFSLTVFEFTVGDLGTGAAEKVAVVSDYRDEIPSDPSIVIDNDIDGDGIYNLLDPDIDGDGVPNEIDPDPYDPNVYNLPPTGAEAITMGSEVKEGEVIYLSATATDPNNDPLTYTWTVDRIPSWTRTGQEIELLASGDFKPGTYMFTVTVSDGKAAQTASDSVQVIIIKDDDGPSIPLWLIVLIIGISVIAIITLVYFFVIKGKDEEEPVEIEPDPAYGGSGMEVPSKSMVIDDEEDDTIIDDAIPSSPAIAPRKDEMIMDEDSDEEDVQQLEQLIEDLEKTEEEIQDLCPECSASLGPMDEVCPNCGSEFELALECPNCSTVVEEGLDSCPKCGVLFK